jgi:hypothetical protein
MLRRLKDVVPLRVSIPMYEPQLNCNSIADSAAAQETSICLADLRRA